MFVAVADDAGVGIGDGGQEVGCCLTLWTFETEILEIRFCVVCGAKEDTSPFIDNENFIE